MRKNKTTTNPAISKDKGLPQWLNGQIVLNGVSVSIPKTIIFLLAILIYTNSTGNGYTLDDSIVITDNMFTQKGVAGIGDHFTNELFYGFFKDKSKANLVAGGRYRPLSMAMFALEYELVEDSPWLGHVINVLLYGFTGIMLYLVLMFLFRGSKKESISILLPFLATLLYVSHPIHTEVVANIKGRDEILALLGALTSMYYILKAHSEESIKWLAVGTLLFFITLMGKENAVTYLAVIPIALYFFRNATVPELVKHTAPLVGAVAIFLFIRGRVLPGSDLLGEPSRELMNNPFLKIEGNQYVDFTIGERIASVLNTWLEYIKLLIFPHPLSHDYYPRQYDLMTFGDWQVILAVIVFGVIGFVGLRSLKTKSILGFCAIYFLATFSIVSNMLFPIGTWVSERFMYMASVGFCLALAYGIIQLSIWLKAKGTISQPIHKVALLTTIVIASLYSVKTISRNTVWKDNYTLFTTDVEVSTRSAKLQNASGGIKIDRASKINDPAQKNKLLTEAVAHLNQAVEIHPTYKNAYLLRGNANNNLKNFDAAISDYGQALRLDPGYSEASRNLVVTYAQAGRYYGEEKGDIGKAQTYLLKAYQLDAKNYEVNRLLGISYGVAGQHTQAIRYFTEAAQIKPNDATAWVNLSKAYFYINDTAKQNEYRQKALSLDANAFNAQ